MQAMHLWLHSLTRMPLYPRLKIKEEQKIGDKPGVEVAEPAVEAGLMMLYKAFKSSLKNLGSQGSQRRQGKPFKRPSKGLVKAFKRP